MAWLAALERARAQREPVVLVTITAVRGHAPREAGAKMVVGEQGIWGSIGGGNLEATMIQQARAMLLDGTPTPLTAVRALNPHARNEFGTQCCGGEVTVLLEPVPVVASVAIFGLGHVGVELARILARHDLDLHLVDSRSSMFSAELPLVLDDAVARVTRHHAPVPELVLGQVPAGTDVFVMTHDHAEDAAICDAALRCSHLGAIGLIGSSAKRSRFRRLLAEQGHDEHALDRIECPIGLPGMTSKEPAAIAVSVAAQLLSRISTPAIVMHQ